ALKYTARTLVLFFAFLFVSNSRAQMPEGVEESLLDVNQEVVASGFKIPWAIAVIDDEEYLISDRMGTLYHYRDGEAVALEGIPVSLPFEIGGFVYGGLMDVSLHPRFAENRLVYIALVNQVGRMVVSRFRFADRTVRDLKLIFESNAFSIGSRIAWSDDDHFFVSLGMGGYPRPDPGAQDLAMDVGKIHRLMADGTVPADNPVFDGATAPTSIWSYGHRDPQGLYFDAEAGILYATEHGPMGGDELNIVQGGSNYGWPLFSYGVNYDGSPVSELTAEEAGKTTVLPEMHWGPDFNMAPSGLERLDGALFPALTGYFVIGSLAQRRLIAFDVASKKTRILLNNIGRVRDIAELSDGSLLILLDAGSPDPSDTGRVVKLTPR
ncbi:MAG: PQQ-dependent sugar dehydrogenase, partial [Rhodothermales bacterium]